MNRPVSEDIRKGLAAFDAQHEGKLLTYLNSCVRCGLCAGSCMYYMAMPDARFIPSRKVDLVSSVYKRYRTIQGMIIPGLAGARDLDEETLREMVDLLYGACTMCGRCNTHCSIGIDIAYVVRTGRNLLANMGLVPATLQSTVTTAVETGNNMGIPVTDFVDTLKWMEEELTDEVGDPGARIPVDEPGKTVMYTLNPREPKFFPLSISAMAKVFYAAGESWTLSTAMYDITNYAYFSGNPEEARLIAERLWNETKRLGSSTLVLAECGHGTRALRWESPNYLGKPFPFRVLTSVEIMAGYLRSGKIKTDPSRIRGAVTLHDPCNLVRSGGIIEEQRYIVRQCTTDFREMQPYGTDNHCCGGGGGQLAMSEYNDRRMKIAGIKAEQIRRTGAEILVSPCHNCVDQLTQINVTFRLNVQIKTLAELVADAIVLT